MHVKVDEKAGFAMFDELVRLRQANAYPFNRRDAVIPQNIIPPEIRNNKKLLACFYFFICIYMRGGIESLQAFNAMIRMWRAHPHLFDPLWAQMHKPSEIQPILRKFVGWDSKAASINWVHNSRRLVEHWDADPLNLIKGMRSYKEAIKRIRNKRTKREQKEVGEKNWGFRGFQPKMVSMLIYFYDWEGWLTPRFLYPSPADFHNFRLGIANGVLKVTLRAGEQFIRANEKLSMPWRDLVMKYLKTRKVDPILFADAVWLFSLVNCGNSPLNVTKVLPPRTHKIRGKDKKVIRQVPAIGLFEHSKTEERWEPAGWGVRKRLQLAQTCLTCALAYTCSMSIPSQPYYRKGRLFLNPRPRVEQHYAKLLPPPPQNKVLIESGVLELLPGLHQAAAE